LLSILPHDRDRRLEPDADATTLVDIGALGGKMSDDILDGQYRCHAATLTCRFATIAIMGVKSFVDRKSAICARDTRDRYLACRHPDANGGMSDTPLPTKIGPKNRLLTSAEFQHLATVPPEVEWFANIRNKSTRRAYETAMRISWALQALAARRNSALLRGPMSSPGARILRTGSLGARPFGIRLAALSSLFEYLCEKNAVTHNPVKGVKRPRSESGEGKTPALGDHQEKTFSSPNITVFG
jgi:hypothetical protein